MKTETKKPDFDTQEIKQLLFYLMIAVVVGMCVYVIVKINDGSINCMANPWSYKLKSIFADQPVFCSCSCSFLNKGEILYITPKNTSILNYNEDKLILP